MRYLLPILSLALLSAAPAAAQERVVTESEAVHAALAASFDARAARADQSAADAAVRVANGARRPTMSIAATGGHSESLASSIGGAVVRQQQDSVSLTSSASLVSDIGTTVDLGLSSNIGWRTANLNPASTTLNTVGPIYTTNLTLDVRQPLLRGAGEDAILGSERQARASARAAELTTQQTISTLVRDVLVAHHELAYAQSALELSEAALALARTQLERAQASESLGSGTRLDVLRYASALATAESNLRTSQAQHEQAAITLGTLLGLDAASARGLHVETSTAEAASVASVEILAERANLSSPELAALDANVHAARELERLRADADQLQLDLVGSVAAGVVYNGTTIETLTLPDGRPALSGSLGLELTFPMGPGETHAQYTQASAQLEAAVARFEARVRTLVSEIASGRAEWASADERVGLAAAARDASHELAEAERAGLSLGTVTSVEVVTAQQDERSAALNALRASADRREAEIRLAHLTGSLLDAFGVDVEANITETP